MNRKIYHIFSSLVAVLLLATSCVSEGETPKGWLEIGKPTMEVMPETRTASEEIDYLVSIAKGNVVVMTPIRYSALSGSIPLDAGESYVLKAESCTETEAESQPTIFGQPRYAGTKSFSIEANKKTTVEIKCSMANAAFKIVKDASFYYESYEVTATVGDRTLTFTDEDKMGYFNVGEDGTAVLHYTVQAVDAEGRTGSGQGEITLKARNLSNLTLKANAPSGINVSINYDDTFTPVITEIILPEE